VGLLGDHRVDDQVAGVLDLDIARDRPEQGVDQRCPFGLAHRQRAGVDERAAAPRRHVGRDLGLVAPRDLVLADHREPESRAHARSPSLPPTRLRGHGGWSGAETGGLPGAPWTETSQAWRRWEVARSISRRCSRSITAWRFSNRCFPLPTPRSTFASPCEKYTRSGTSVRPFSAVTPFSRSISRR